MSARGFTLVEVVVAMTVLSLVLLATVTGLRTLAATQRTLQQQAERNDELRAVSTFLRDALESTVASSGTGGLSLGGDRRTRSVFAMTEESLLWESVLLFGEGRGGMQLVRVAREDTRLVLRWAGRDALRADFDWQGAPSRVLVEDLQEFSVAYRREPRQSWVSRWDRRDAPGWVRLRIRSRDRYWPDLVVRVAH